MIRLTRAQLQPIGLDIGHDSVKLLQLETSGHSLAVHAAAREPLPDEARQLPPEQRIPLTIETIRRAFRQNPFSGRRVIASLPREIVHVKNIRLPMIPADELESAVKFEAKNIFSFDTDAAAVRYLSAGEVRQGTDVRQEVIVLAAKNEEIENYLEQLHRCGVIVESLDFEPCAIYRSVERFIRRREDEQEVYVLVDVGLSGSQVVIGRGREISFFKSIDIGDRHLTESVSRRLGISIDEAKGLRRRLIEQPTDVGTTDASTKRDPVRQAVQDATRGVMEELGREISLCLRYHSVTFRGHRPAKVRLVGGESCDPSLHACLNAALTIPVEAGKPLISVDTSRMKPADRVGSVGEWAVALGLGLKLTTGNFGARDGKPREAAPAIVVPTPAEVVDLDRALDPARKSAAPVLPAGSTSTSSLASTRSIIEIPPPTGEEAIHA